MLELIRDTGKRTKYGGKIGLYKCDCTKEKELAMSVVDSGRKKDCGCVTIGRTKDPMYNSPEYKAWSQMHTRCYNTKFHAYNSYGGKGVIVCDRWRVKCVGRRIAFKNFYKDMGPMPFPDAELDRINENGIYTKDNCQWISSFDNKSRKAKIFPEEYLGKKQSIPMWAREFNISYKTLWYRLCTAKWDIEKALITPLQIQGDANGSE